MWYTIFRTSCNCHLCLFSELLKEWNTKYVLLFESTSEHPQAVHNWSNVQFSLLLIVCNESSVILFISTEFCKEQWMHLSYIISEHQSVLLCMHKYCHRVSKAFCGTERSSCDTQLAAYRSLFILNIWDSGACSHPLPPNLIGVWVVRLFILFLVLSLVLVCSFNVLYSFCCVKYCLTVLWVNCWSVTIKPLFWTQFWLHPSDWNKRNLRLEVLTTILKVEVFWMLCHIAWLIVNQCFKWL
jgi:hypothetical protein